jgi:AraC-like DNA-binding protein
VSFTDAGYFIRLFRREHGVTPAAWRAGQRQPTGGGRRNTPDATANTVPEDRPI